MKAARPALFILIAGLIAAFFIFDLGQYFTLDFLKAGQDELDAFYRQHPVQTALLFFSVYVICTGLSLPAAAIMTLAGGAIFGLLWGTLLASFASVLGATLAFLAARFLFRKIVQERFAAYLVAINHGMEKEGAFYLFTLRLVPVFPFFIINVVMGLTHIRTLTFALVSQVAMLLPTMVFVNAGTQLAKINTPADVLSPALIGSFILLGVFPLLAKKSIEFIKSRKAVSAAD